MSKPLVRSAWAVPGGTSSYISSLRIILKAAWDSPNEEIYIDRLMRKFPTISSVGMMRRYVRYMPHGLGLVEEHRGKVRLTDIGREFLEVSDPKPLLRQALLDQVHGVRRILEVLAVEPLPIRKLKTRLLNDGFDWTEDTQIRYRLNWLLVAGAVEHRTHKQSIDRYPEWAVLEPGRVLLKRRTVRRED